MRRRGDRGRGGGGGGGGGGAHDGGGGRDDGGRGDALPPNNIIRNLNWKQQLF